MDTRNVWEEREIEEKGVGKNKNPYERDKNKT